MKPQEIILFTAEYIDLGLDPKTVSVPGHELKDHPEVMLFLMDCRHTRVFYRRHQDEGKFDWMVEYLDQRIHELLREFIEDLSSKRPRKTCREG